MNTIRKSIVIGLTVLGLAGSTFAAAHEAHVAHKATTEHQQGKKHGNWAERHAQRTEKLHASLQLTPPQEAAWATYVAATKPQARAEGQRLDKGTWQAMAAPERMEKRLAMAKLRVERMQARLEATSVFYATLTPAQKKLFDERSMRRGGHHRHHTQGQGAQPAMQS